MSIEMLFNKKLRKHYKEAMSIKTKKECDRFFNKLNKKEKIEILTYIEVYEIPKRIDVAASTDEYILSHYKEYLTEDDIQVKKKADTTFRVISAASVIFVGVITWSKYL